MNKNITELFNKFAGREVLSRGSGGIDPVISEIGTLAAENGLKLRVWWPGMMGTMDYRTDRLNVHIEKGADGKYRVGNRFNIG